MLAFLRDLGFKVPNKNTMQKIGSLTVLLFFASVVLFNIFQYIFPYIKDKINDDRAKMKSEIISELKLEISKLETRTNILYIKLDSSNKKITYLHKLIDIHKQVIILHVDISHDNPTQKINQIKLLLDENNKN